jgi:hypothetical protein
MSGIFIHPKTGNVGIGLTNPRTALEVNGTITASNISVIGDFVRLNTVTSNTEQMVIENAGTGPALKVTQTGANSIAEFYDDGNVLALKIADGGNIGIGTGIPMAKLEVNVAPVLVGGDPTYRGDIRIVSQGGGSILNSTGGIEFKISNSGPGYGWRINAPDATGTNEGTPLSIQSRIGSATWTNNLIIKGDGNVGIGTTNPQAKLHIHGPTAPGLLAKLSDGTTNLTVRMGLKAGTAGLTNGWVTIDPNPEPGVSVPTTGIAIYDNLHVQGNLNTTGYAYAPGAVIQTLYYQHFNAASHIENNNALFNASGIFVDITPKSTSSRILINFSSQCSYVTLNTSYHIQVRKNAVTFLSSPTLYNNGGATCYFPLTTTAIDSPNTTSSIRYEIYYGAASGANRVILVHNGYLAYLVVQEIGV